MGEGQEPTHEPLPPPAVPAGEEKRTVLLAEDAEAPRKVATLMLESLGLRVLVATDGAEALEVFRQNAAVVCLVLLDVIMPRLNGEETLRQLRQLRPGLPAILMSGHTEDEVMGRVAGEGPSAFLQKPFRLTDLVIALERVLPS